MNTIPQRTRRPRRSLVAPTLRFTPWAWAKLLYLRDAGPTEVGGFGITETSDRSLITDITLVSQSCTSISVAFDDVAVADFFDHQVNQGLRPDQFGRIWLHTHPGECPQPSDTDEETFTRVFGSCDWALMFILARKGASYARLRFNTGPGGELGLAVEVDYRQPFPAARQDSWQFEYDRCIDIQEQMPVFDFEAFEKRGARRPRNGNLEYLVPDRVLGAWDEY